VIGDWRYAVGHARDGLKNLHQLRIDPLRHGAVRLEQLVAGFVEELRIRTELLAELVQRAGEADLLHDLVHLGADTRDFAYALFVDLLWGQVGRGEALRQVGVKVVPFRHLPDANLGKARRQIFRFVVALQLLEGGNDVGADHVFGR
jgi:hypothetical protein